MVKRAFAVGLVVALAAVLAACAPVGGEPAADSGPVTAAGDQAAEPSSPDQAVMATGSEDEAPAAQAGETALTTVDVTPMSEAELAAEGPGQSEAGGAADEPGETEPGAGEAQPAPSDWTVYVDEAFGFSVAHPADFVVAQPDNALLAGLIPQPAAAVYFMDPVIADSALAGTDAPDLEVRIFETGSIASLADWLASAAASSGQTVTPVTVGTLEGLQVCESTMIVPGCTTFVAGDGRVYQLRSLTLEGETMAGTFALTR